MCVLSSLISDGDLLKISSHKIKKFHTQKKNKRCGDMLIYALDKYLMELQEELSQGNILWKARINT